MVTSSRLRVVSLRLQAASTKQAVRLPRDNRIKRRPENPRPVKRGSTVKRISNISFQTDIFLDLPREYSYAFQ